MSGQSFPTRHRWWVFLTLAILAGGASLSWWMAQGADRAMRDTLCQQAKLLTETIHADRITQLSGSNADLDNPDYLRLKAQCITVGQSRDSFRKIQLIGRTTQGRLFSFVDSDPTGSGYDAHPDQEYTELPEPVQRVFRSGLAETAGPYVNRRGTSMTALAPILDLKTNTVIAVLGMDVDAQNWNRHLVRAAMPSMLLTLALLAPLFAAMTLFDKRARLAGHAPVWMHGIEPALVVVVGLALTTFAVWIVHQQERHNRQDMFARLAASRTLAIADVLQDIRAVELEGLARFFAGSEYVDHREFKHFTGYLTQNPAVQAWVWVPAVSAADRLRFEEEARAAGLTGFEIWQEDAQGQKIPAATRDVYYPVFQAAPLEVNDYALGFDLGSEPLRRGAMEEARRTGLATASDPVALVLESSENKGLVVFRPVFDDEDPSLLRGFALAVLRMSKLLEYAAGLDTSAMHMDIAFLRHDGEIETLASSCSADQPLDAAFTLKRPIFAFGKVFVVNAHAGPTFFHIYPARAAWFAALTGAGLTSMLAVLLGMVFHRRSVLELLVAERTSKLRESEERFQAFMNETPVYAYIKDRTLAHVYQNKRVTELAKMISAASDGRSARQIFDKETADALEQADVKVLEGHTERVEIEYFLHIGNEVLWLYDVKFQLELANGNRGVGGLAFDITERKKTEEALREREEQLALVLEGSELGFWDWNIERNTVHRNERWAAMLGYSLDEVEFTVKQWEDFLHPDDRAAAWQAIKEHLDGRTPTYRCEYRMLTKDGKDRWILDQARVMKRGADGRPLRMCGTHTDITERKMVEEALRESEERFRLLFDNAPLPYQSLDEQGYFLTVNKRWLETLGYTTEEVVGHWFGDFLTPSFREHFDRNFPMFKQACFIDGVEFQMLRKDGTAIHVSFNGRVQLDKSGRFMRSHCIFTDITEKKRAEESLLQAKEAAESASRSKSEFLANMSHELRTPMNGVLGMLHLLQTTTIDKEQKEYIQHAIKSSKRLTRLLSDILDLSRIEAGRLPLLETAFEIEEQKRSLLELFSSTAREKGLDLECIVHSTTPPVLIGDESRLRQILFNLVGNALKFTEQGGVRIEITALHTIDSNRVRVLFTVSDTGIGIPDDRLTEIFEPFTQIEGEYTRRFQGAGLGLSIVRKLVNMMRGELTIGDSEEGGTTMYLSLPFRLPESTEAIAAKAGEADRSPVGRPGRILFADDDEVSLLSGRKMLENAGYEVVTASDGQEALARLAEQDFDLVLMDVQMPVMDGVAATRAIRTSGKPWASIPIVALTAYAMGGDREVFLLAGMDGYVSKPVEMETLHRAISEAMQRLGGEGPPPLPVETAPRD